MASYLIDSMEAIQAKYSLVKEAKEKEMLKNEQTYQQAIFNRMNNALRQEIEEYKDKCKLEFKELVNQERQKFYDRKYSIFTNADYIIPQTQLFNLPIVFREDEIQEMLRVYHSNPLMVRLIKDRAIQQNAELDPTLLTVSETLEDIQMQTCDTVWEYFNSYMDNDMVFMQFVQEGLFSEFNKTLNRTK